MGLRRSGRRPLPQRLRSRTPGPDRRRWWQGWQVKTALVSALVPLVVGALWVQGVKLVHAWSDPAPRVSASARPSASPGGTEPAPSGSPLPEGTPPGGAPPVDPSPDDVPPENDPVTSGPTTTAPEPSATTGPPAPSVGPVTSEARVRRGGTLVMADYTAYDLDSTAADWNPTRDDWGPSRDVGYASWWPDASNDALVSREDPRYAAALSGSGPWSRADCVRARYGEPSARPVGDRLLEGRGICVVTSSGRYALLVVTRAVERQLTVRVTVWE
ncbi:hypothetical protein [Micromonospora sp. NBRC 101691]|uniref:hypothetical protein n=1 Tax=Micromonospora sp. NBRC 101691 TaxID=3032198 RepID=UPI00249FC571|nr:hypothetical protein [Micromonospora sp. NBRC 101691]GLY24280.1 hypothetical protein Misp04_40120 [Micromonospora sp. NBRC 101691]